MRVTCELQEDTNNIESLFYESFAHLVHNLGEKNCESKIFSPDFNSTWTSAYLRVDWKICEDLENIEALYSVQLDGPSVWQGTAGLGHFTIFGIQDGSHTLSIDALDSQANPRKAITSIHFVVSRGISLLGSMAKKVEKEPSMFEYKKSKHHDYNIDDSQDETNSTDDVTFVTAAIDIGRRHGNISFEDDYIGNLRHLLSLEIPLVIHLQSKNVPHIEPYLHSRAVIRIKVCGVVENRK